MNFSDQDKKNFIKMEKMIKEIVGKFRMQISELSNQKRDIMKEFTKELENRKVDKICKD